jgi:autoinducer 2 (AI-2) kinase
VVILSSTLLLTIDFGTYYIKTLLFTPTGEIRVRRVTPIIYYDPTGLVGIGKEFDSQKVWTAITQLIRQSIKDAKCSANEINGIAVTSQRLGTVFLDKQGSVIYAGPNLDGRGILVQDAVAEQLETACPPTGCWPPLLYSLCRLLWFKQHKPDDFSSIQYILAINDWLVFQLTGKITTDPSQASSTQFMDIQTSMWSSEILELADISEDFLPPICEIGSVAGDVSRSVAKETGLSPTTPVAIAGADTQCALLGSGITEHGDVCIVAGNTAPIQLVTDKPIIDSERHLWTGRHLIPNRWVLEANTGASGSVLTWFAEKILGETSLTKAANDIDLYSFVEKLAAQAPMGSNDAFALLGPQIMDARDVLTIRPSILLFPPLITPLMKPVSIKDFARALYENICYAMRANLSLIQSLAEISLEKCTVAGGLTRSRFWQQMLADITNLPVSSATVFEASSLGAAICAAQAVEIYDSIDAGVKNMVKLLPSLKPREAVHQKYNTLFTRWQTLYKQSASL